MSYPEGPISMRAGLTSSCFSHLLIPHVSSNFSAQTFVSNSGLKLSWSPGLSTIAYHSGIDVSLFLALEIFSSSYIFSCVFKIYKKSSIITNTQKLQMIDPPISTLTYQQKPPGPIFLVKNCMNLKLTITTNLVSIYYEMSYVHIDLQSPCNNNMVTYMWFVIL